MMALLTAAFLCAYAGFAALCAITRRNRRLVWKGEPTPTQVWALRVVGYMCLLLAWLPCSLAWSNAFMAMVAWICAFSVAAVVLVLPFSYAPRSAVMSGAPAFIMAALLFLAV